MITVYTKDELRKALKAKEKNIIVKGELARTIRAKANKQKTMKKVGIGTAAIGAAALITAPFTAGTSLVAGAAAMGLTAGTSPVAGAAAMGLTVGGLTISAAELAILIGGSLALAGILRGYNVKFNSDGSVELNRS